MKTNLKRILSVVMALVLVVGVFPAAAFAAQENTLTEGSYLVPVASLTSAAPIPAVAQEFAKAFGTQVQVDVDADGQMTAILAPQHMVVNVGGEYHCNILKTRAGEALGTVLETKTELVTPTFGVPDVTENMECPAKISQVLPAANEDGSFNLEVTADFMNGMFGGLDVDHWMDVVLSLDFSKAESLEAAPSYEFGTAKTVLVPGEYELPVSMMKENNHDKPSMAGTCIKGGSLLVNEDGSAVVTLKLGPVSVMGITGWANQWKIFNEYNTTSATTDCQVLEQDAEGHETAVSFTLPYSDQDGVYCQMYVEAMRMTSEAFLKLDFAHAVPNGTDPTDPVDPDPTDPEPTDPEPTDPEPSEPAAPTYEFGTAKTVLLPGEYDLPISMMNASNIEKPSMAGSCVLGGSLVVNEDGSAKVTMKLGPVSVMGLTGWSSQWEIFNEFNMTSSTTACEIVSRDEEGHETAVSFMLPFNDQDGVYGKMFVEVMNMNPEAYLKLDFANATVPQEPEKPQLFEDGNYYVDIVLSNAFKDEPSMGNKAFEHNAKALLTVENGVVTKVQMGSNPVRMGTIYSAITEIKVDGQDVTVVEAQPLTTMNGEQEVGQYDYVKSFSFSMPQAGQPVDAENATFVPVTFLVPDTPMGNAPMEARIKFCWAAAAKTEDVTLETNAVCGGDKQLVLVDDFYGVTLKAIEANLSLDAQLEVSAAAGDELKSAEQAMIGVDRYWDAFRILTTVNGEAIAPTGSVTLIFSGADENTAVYRITPEGMRIPVMGFLKGDSYVINARQLGLYVVAGKPVAHFTDVPAGYWAEDAIQFVVKEGLFEGTSATTFAPKDAMTRGMFVTVLGRLAGVKDDYKVTDQFTDVKADAYFAPYVAWAVDAGIAKGVSDTAFNPYKPISRQEMAVLLYRFCQAQNIELDKTTAAVDFTDKAEISAYALEAVNAIAAADLMEGNADHSFEPQANALRAQVAAVLMRLVVSYGL